MNFNNHKLAVVIAACLGVSGNLQAADDSANDDQDFYDQMPQFHQTMLDKGWGWSASSSSISDDCNTEFETRLPPECFPPPPPPDPKPSLPIDDPILGFSELHSHLMAEHSFGGKWYHGNADGRFTHAVKRCSGNLPKIKLFGITLHDFGPKHGNIDLAKDLFPDIGINLDFGPLVDQVASEFVGVYRQTSTYDKKGTFLTLGDTGLHLGKRRGFDNRRCKKFLWWNVPGTCPKTSYADWPSWDTMAHQQMWFGWLQQANNKGLNIMMVSLAESKLLCHRMPGNHANYVGCNEMDSISRQMEQLKAYVARNDWWVEIALSPQHAREIIQTKRKLALVVSAEVTDLFPAGKGSWRYQLDKLYNAGFRSVQLAHHGNNDFAGAAPIPKLVDLAGKIDDHLYDSNFTTIDEPECEDNCNGTTQLNRKGLSTEGRALVTEMMSRGMLVDVAHSSRRTIQEVYHMSMQHNSADPNANDPYPMFYSHAHFLDTAANYEVNEKYITKTEAAWIAQTNGMVGLRTGPERTKSYSPSGVANNCHGSSRSFAQSFAYGIDQGLKIGFGADFNGFTHQMLPRDGHRIRDTVKVRDGKESCGGWESHNNAQASTLVTDDYISKGLAHIGLLPNLIEDLDRVGLKQNYLDAINSSAEQFVQTWELAVKNK